LLSITSEVIAFPAGDMGYEDLLEPDMRHRMRDWAKDYCKTADRQMKFTFPQVDSSYFTRDGDNLWYHMRVRRMV
jgi:hypothetical protein